MKHKGIMDQALPKYKILFLIKFLNLKHGCYNRICHVLVQVEITPHNCKKDLPVDLILQ
jgi:hypothetical protein